MQIAARKPIRTLWQSQDAEGRDTYEWCSNHQDGTPIEPHSCIHYSKRQADLAWADKNPPGKAGRPASGKPASEGNPTLQIRFPRDVLDQIYARGGTEWVRKLVEEALHANP